MIRLLALSALVLLLPGLGMLVLAWVILRARGARAPVAPPPPRSRVDGLAYFAAQSARQPVTRETTTREPAAPLDGASRERAGEKLDDLMLNARLDEMWRRWANRAVTA